MPVRAPPNVDWITHDGIVLPMQITNPPVQENNYKAGRGVDASILKRFGLTNNDISVYQALFAIGRTRTGAIIKETGVANSRVYASLQNLLSRGLASYQVKNNVKYYQAELPSELIEKAQRDALRLKQLSRTLSQLPITKQDRNETNTFEGIRGLKMAYEQHMDGLEKGETISIIAFVGPEFRDSPDLREFFTNVVDKKQLAKKVKGRMITHKMLGGIIKKDRPDASIYDIRYLSKSYTLPYTLNISRKEVMISVWGDNPIVFSIKNPIVVTAFQKNFDYMWGLAKKS
jgi:predicted DNA-binding transcriptional regulator